MVGIVAIEVDGYRVILTGLAASSTLVGFGEGRHDGEKEAAASAAAIVWRQPLTDRNTTPPR
jgi:hypothetical protein